jgi:glycosyltransferase involved in cell wall biosynthesis
MAVYEPRPDWLREQLASLNAQTYPNLKLYVRDDCSPTVPFEAVRACVAECITAFPYEIRRNEKNLGSNKTFERLTAAAEGELLAYCDQDDVWLPEKLEVLQELLARTGAGLVCSDMTVLDGEGNVTATSITQVRKTHRFARGEELFPLLLTRNFVTGCTMLVSGTVARQAIPFPDTMIHDHWIALCAAAQGRVEYSERPLIGYRIHGGNQTGFLKGCDTKEAYVALRIDAYCERMETICRRFPDRSAAQQTLAWARARRAYARRERGAARALYRLRATNRKTTLFELLTLRLPEPLFRAAVASVRRMLTGR